MNPAETLSGAYSQATLTLPDGTLSQVLVRRVNKVDGTLGYVVVDDDTLAFERRFQDTETVPAAFAETDTKVLTRKSHEESTRMRLMSADMLAFIGDPDRILAQNSLDKERLEHLRAHPSSATLARRICTNMGGKWARVALLIPQYMADRRP